MEFFLTPSHTASVVYLIGLAIAIAYLVYLPQKTRDSKLILALMLSWFLYGFAATAFGITHTYNLMSGPGYMNGAEVTYFYYLSWYAFLLFLVVLMYRIGFSFSVWEERILIVGLGVIVLYTTYFYARNLRNASDLIVLTRLVTQAGLAVMFWVAIAGCRKLWVAHHAKRDLRSKRLVAMLTLTSIAGFFHTLALSFLTVIWPFSAELRGIIPALMSVTLAGLLIIGYLLYSPEKHTLQVKLVGFLVLAYITIFSVVIPFMRTEVGLRQSFLDSGDRSSLVFAPDSLGGYSLEHVPRRWIDPTGSRHNVADDAAVMIQSAFSFPFYGGLYDSIWVGSNGSISFGRELDADQTFSTGQSFYDATPTALPMYADYVLAGADAFIMVDASPDRYLVTWSKASLYDLHESTVTMQAALYPSGTVEFNYNDITSLPLLRYTGISGGGPAEPVSFEASAIVGAPRQALFEFHDQREAYRRFVHPLVVNVALIGIIGLFVVLFGGILFYRVGILNPLMRVLTGLRSVEEGDLNATVEIAERNELGALADHFNRMTTSIRNYNEHLEEMVEERTADLRSTQAKLVEQEKLASLGSLTAGIAHEIKNPLNFVNNFAEVSTELVEELSEAIAGSDNAAAQSILKEISENAVQIAKHGKRADSIVRAMMQHARGGTSEQEEVNLNEFIEEYVNLSWHGMRAKDHGFQAGVVRRYDEKIGEISVQPQEMGRVILNLLNNAFDALKDTDSAEVTVATRRTEGAVEITVSDNGPGIPPEIRERIFEPFFTTKATGEGTGLGLSLSYDIVTKGHGGTMTVETSPQGGAQFVVTLPV